MAILKFNETKIKPVALGVTGLFLCLAAVYFIPAVPFTHKIALPVAALAIAGLWTCPWYICAALAFSCLGDLMGSCGLFIGQMGFFAAAHICLIWFFIKRYREKVERDRKLTDKAMGYTFLIVLISLFIACLAIARIVLEVPAGALRIGTGVYTIVICGMLTMALLQRSSLYALGAVLFVFSDFVLAWNLFVEPIRGAGLMIMIPYYLAQWLFYIRSTSFRVAPEMRLMRF